MCSLRQFKDTGTVNKFKEVNPLVAMSLKAMIALILCVFNTGNSSLEPLLEGLLAQIHMVLSFSGFWPESNWDLRITHISVRCRARIYCQ